MLNLRRKLIVAEIIVATRLGALGDWWAASAARRLGKLSGEQSETRPRKSGAQ